MSAYLTPTTPETGVEYQLVEWSPGKAEDMVILMRGYLNTLEHPEYPHLQLWYITNPMVEITLLFPNHPQANNLNWGIARRLSSEPSLGNLSSNHFSNLIYNLLVNNQLTPEEIPAWVANIQPDIKIEVNQLTPLEGYTSNHVISILSKYSNGSIHYWVRETENIYAIELIRDELGLDFSRGILTDVIVTDLTGDRAPELLLTFNFLYRWENISYIHIYSFDQIPAQELSFLGDKSKPLIFDNGNWPTIIQGEALDQLQVQSRIPGETLGGICPILTTTTYQWNGEWFQQVEQNVEVEDFDTLTNCNAGIGWSPKNLLALKNQIPFLESLIPYWPFFETWKLGGEKILPPPDILLYYLGIHHMLEGNSSEAKEYMQTIINTPSIPNSQWIKPAEKFLSTYQSNNDIFKICQQSVACNNMDALEFYINNLETQDLELAIIELKSLGIPILNSGAYDFDPLSNVANQTEYWFVIPSENGNEFWILANSPQGKIKALFVNNISNIPPTITTLSPFNNRYLYQLSADQQFTFHRLETNQEPFVFLYNTAEATIDEPSPHAKYDTILGDLLTGTDPNIILGQLLQLNPEEYYSYYYYLGFTYQLIGIDTAAAEAYLSQWILYPESPYTLMARFKLEKAP